MTAPALARFAADLDAARANSRALAAQWTELVAAYRDGRGPAHQQPDTEESSRPAPPPDRPECRARTGPAPCTTHRRNP